MYREEYSLLVPRDLPQEAIAMSNLSSAVGLRVQLELFGEEERSPNYEGVLRGVLRDALSEIGIPSSFRITELVDFLTTRFLKVLREKDPEFLQILEDLLDFDTIPSSLERLKDFADVFSNFNDKMKSYTVKVSDVWSLYFYISDLPLSLFSEFSLLLQTDKSFTEHITRSSKRLTKIRYRSLEREVNKFLSEIEEVSTLALIAKRSYLKLFLFIQIQNARDYEDLFKIRPFSNEKLKSSEYRKLRLEFSKDLYEYRKKLEFKSPILFQQEADKETEVLWSTISSLM